MNLLPVLPEQDGVPAVERDHLIFGQGVIIPTTVSEASGKFPFRQQVGRNDQGRPQVRPRLLPEDDLVHWPEGDEGLGLGRTDRWRGNDLTNGPGPAPTHR